VAYSVYILKCKDGTLYTGIATDVERRLTEHRGKKGARYTRAKGAGTIVYKEEVGTRSNALKREAEIKKWRREKKLQLIKK
jgi:predicted GIY-YIG superfamily endonuclease